MLLRLILILGSVHHIWSLKPSPGCQIQKSLTKDFTETVHLLYTDKGLGPVERKYIIQVPKFSENDNPLMAVLDLHGWTDSADTQVHNSGWRHLGQKEGFVVIWPDGMGDSPNSMGSWNCSMTTGPLGPTCDTNRAKWNVTTECYNSCPLCDGQTSCDWTSCYDDIGFLDFVIQHVSENWCIDLDHLHLSGMSNGGMFAYFLASEATDGLGLASINPNGASSLIGFGNPPPVEINFSIVDFHGIADDNIPYNESMSFGQGPHDSLISFDGFYYDKKQDLLRKWAEQMQCDEQEFSYSTPYDGVNDFQCFQRSCKNGKDILRCIGDYGHYIPMPNHPNIGAEVAFEFMKNHPRQ